MFNSIDEVPSLFLPTASQANTARAMPQFIFRSSTKVNILQVDMPGISDRSHIFIVLYDDKLTVEGHRYLPMFNSPLSLKEEEEEYLMESNKNDSLYVLSRVNSVDSDSSISDSETSMENGNKRKRTATDSSKVNKIVYKRVFQLGRRIDQNKIQVTSFENGVLTILMPNLVKAKPRKIPVCSKDEKSPHNPNEFAHLLCPAK